MDNQLNGKRVLITGGASGIGRLMAGMAQQLGAELVLWDRDATNLEKAGAELSKTGKVSTQVVDVTNLQQVQSAAAEVLSASQGIDVLINNAGIVVGKYFADHTFADIQQTMAVNAMAPMYITSLFLPSMISRGGGNICNIASSAGLSSNPHMSVYVASKWSVTGWSDSLRIEMQQQRTGVKVTTVTPYYISTGMFAGVRSPLVPILRPEKVARKIIRGMLRGKIFVSMPWSVHFVRLSQGLLPIRAYDWLVGGVMGVYHGMETFKGRNQ